MKSKFLTEYIQIIEDLIQVIKKEKIPIRKLPEEKSPESIRLVWKTLINQQIKQTTPFVSIQKKIFSHRNYSCNLCEDRFSGIKDFYIQGKIHLLVLYYSGEINKEKKNFIKMKDKQIFRNEDEENLFEKMIQKSFGFSHRNFYYQEFPACNFNHQNSTEEDWKRRTKYCTKLVQETIKKEKIKGVIFLGNSGLLFFGEKKAKSLLKKIFNIFDLPAILLRSPASICSIEQKKKKYEKKSSEFQKWEQEEISIKNKFWNN